jgi:hypothetical protein
VSTAPFNTAWQAYTFWRNRWGIENSGFRELKEGWHLEEALWTFHNTVVAAARLTTFACTPFVWRSGAGLEA